MIGNYFERKWQPLMYSNSDFRIWISNVDWRNIKVSDSKMDLIGRHWTKTGPTYARWRTIVIDGYIIATTRANTNKGMDWIDSLFSLQWQLGEVELFDFMAVDEQARQWILKCKVETPPTYSIEEDNDHNDWSLRKFRVSIFAPDPQFYSSTETEVTGLEWDISWLAIWDEWVAIWIDGLPLISYYNEITFVAWIAQSPLLITLDVTGTIDSPLMLWNLTTWNYFYVDITASPWDTIVIDSDQRKVFKNGADITYLRIPWSSRPVAFGLTQIILFDPDGWLYESDFNISVKYRDALL